MRTVQELRKVLDEDKEEADRAAKGLEEDEENGDVDTMPTWSKFPPEMSHQIYGEQ